MTDAQKVIALRAMLTKLVKTVPFTPTPTGIKLEFDFALIKEIQNTLKDTE